MERCSRLTRLLGRRVWKPMLWTFLLSSEGWRVYVRQHGAYHVCGWARWGKKTFAMLFPANYDISCAHCWMTELPQGSDRQFLHQIMEMKVIWTFLKGK